MKSLRNLTAIALTAVLAFVISGCSSDGGDDPVLPLPLAHVHAYSDSWTSNETHHWHAATCEHDVKKDEASHEWDHEDFQLDAASGKEIKICTVCGFVADKNHAHTEDSGTVKTAPTCTEKGLRTYKCTVCDKLLRTEEIPAKGHTEDNGMVTKAVTLYTDGVRTYKCTVCDEFLRKEPITKPKLYESPIDAETGLPATKSSKYIYFGVFPKSVLPANSTLTVDETVFVKMCEDTYYKGSDGEYYAKVKEITHGTGTEYKYSDGTQAKQSSSNSYRYFKVEPIKWKVITDSYSGNCLLLAEDIVTANVPYYDYKISSDKRTVGSDTEIYSNNYKYSQIRAYLNGLDYYYDVYSNSTVKKTDYTGKGFLQTAFTAEAQNLIAVTTVDNSSASTTDSGNNLTEATDYACEDTKDKIFLLSIKEATSYDFPAYNESGSGNARIRKPTDYAMANYAYQNSTAGYGGEWWLRSPYYYYKPGYSNNSYEKARYVYYNGHTFSSSVQEDSIGVVPALSISLQ